MATINTREDFVRFVDEVTASPEYEAPDAFGICACNTNAEGQILDAWFPAVNLQENPGAAAALWYLSEPSEHDQVRVMKDNWYEMAKQIFAPFWNEEGHGNIDAIKAAQERIFMGTADVVRCVFIPDISQPPTSVEDVYLRLHLLSYRKTAPNTVNLDGVFGILPTVAWTEFGPMDPEELELTRREGETFHVYSLDKFPPMLDYVVPGGVRIADASRVRLGAYLAEGTTVMHEGFVNFNAGTLGPCMVEGRISAGVTVGAQTDIGGGASIMGTLSGGGKEKISIGRGCLLGANSGVGISLGDKCVVEAGLYVTAGMPVYYRGKVVKARELSGKSGLTFIRDGQTGQVKALDRPNNVELNDELHSN